jgi:putative oxidoreductase
MDVGILIVRLVVGGLFVGHGVQKLFGWFGGYGLSGTGGFMESLGYRPGKTFAFITGAVEVGAGILLMLGLATPLAAAAVIGVMLNAIFTAKRQAGLFGGWELDLVYLAAAAALAFTGAGAYSLDAAIGWDLSGSGSGLGALAVAGVTAILALAVRRPHPVVVEASSQGEEQKAA